MKIDIKEIKSNLRRNYLRDFSRAFWKLPLLTLAVALGIMGLYFNEQLHIVLVIILALVTIVSVFFWIKTWIKHLVSFLYVIAPQISPIYKKYDLPDFLAKIDKQTVFENDYIVVTNDYLVSKWDYRKIIFVKNIMAVSLYHTIVRESQISYRDKYILNVYDIYGKETKIYTIGVELRNDTNDMVEVLQQINPNIKSGTTQEILAYVKENKIEKNG